MAKKDNIKMTTSVTETPIELRPYLDARTDQLNQAVYLRYAKYDLKKAAGSAGNTQLTDAEKEKMSEDAVEFESLPGTAIAEIKNNAIKGMVVSVDGNTFEGDRDEILEAVLDLPKEDYDEIQAKIDEITKASTNSPKKS